MTNETRDQRQVDPDRTPRGPDHGPDGTADQSGAGEGHAVYGDGVDVGGGQNTAGGEYGDSGGFGGYGTPSSVPSTLEPGAGPDGTGADDGDGTRGHTVPPMSSSSGRT